MTSTGRRVGVIAAWAAAAVLALGAAAGAATVAFADPTPTPSPSSSADSKTDRPNAGKRGLRDFGGRHALRGGQLRGALHGEFVVKNKDGKFVTALTQRGKVTAVDSDSITLKSEDGFTKTYTINDDTRIRSDRKQAKIGDVKVGANAAVVAEKSGDGGTAKMVIVRTESDSD